MASPTEDYLDKLTDAKNTKQELEQCLDELKKAALIIQHRWSHLLWPGRPGLPLSLAHKFDASDDGPPTIPALDLIGKKVNAYLAALSACHAAYGKVPENYRASLETPPD